MGYCGKCNQHYDCHYTVHDEECSGEELPEMDEHDRFEHEKEQQGWDDEMDKEIWDKHFNN